MARNYRFTINKLSGLSLLDQDKQILKCQDQEVIHQLTKVLRVKDPKQENSDIEISFIDGSAQVYEATVQEYVYDEHNKKNNLKEIIFQIDKQYKSERELEQEITFFVPIIKADRFEWMLQKLSELGIQKFVPVIFERSQKANIEKLQNKNQQKRLEKITIEATEQSEGAIFPQLLEPILFKDLTKHLDKDDQRIFASERLASPEELPKSQKAGILANPSSDLQATKIKLLVGPEGGLTDQEVTQLESLGFQAKSLGKRLLKAETASIVLLTHTILG